MNGIELKICRIKAGIRQYKLAAHLGIPQSTLSEIESGKKLLPEQLRKKLREILGANT